MPLATAAVADCAGVDRSQLLRFVPHLVLGLLLRRVGHHAYVGVVRRLDDGPDLHRVGVFCGGRGRIVGDELQDRAFQLVKRNAHALLLGRVRACVYVEERGEHGLGM